ncbi:MAG: 3-phosphoshikimate 1-carboxyvinyltransferase [Candidatus Lernaella stagnicola]|nr:3-phosphoshikimate 1-carboxyvinyltransferase [Candidatus Lernaella stagnicola]
MIRINVPASKSLTQRALLLAALSDCETRLVSPLDCDDSRVLSEALVSLGARIEKDTDAWRVQPPDIFRPPTRPLKLGNAGTAVRFITGLAPLLPGSFVVDGDPAMRRRPMTGLLATLGEMGVEVVEMGKPCCPPIMLNPGPLEQVPAEVSLRAGGSSQELSALLMMGCRLPRGLVVHLEGRFPSRPYVRLTIQTLHAFGIDLRTSQQEIIEIPPKMPHTAEFTIEGDWTSASYPLAAGWLMNQPVEVDNLDPQSEQGDRIFKRLLQRLGQSGDQVFSLQDAPDIVPTVVACALFAQDVTEITGVSHLRIKESDRLAVLARETAKLGADVRELPDGILVRPRPLHGGVQLNPAGDHRMAMAFGLISLRVPDLVVANPDCVTKSYPGYWDMLARFR